jgi:hypothetical protein
MCYTNSERSYIITTFNIAAERFVNGIYVNNATLLNSYVIVEAKQQVTFDLY